MMWLLPLACDPGTDSGTKTPVDTADTAPAPDPCEVPECCLEHEGYVQACGEAFSNEARSGHFTTSESYAGGAKWTFARDDGGESTLLVYGEGAPEDYLIDLAAYGTVTVLDAGGCEWDGEGAQSGAFFIVGANSDPLVVVGSGPASGYGLEVDWDVSGEACLARPGEGCVDAVQNMPLIASYGGETVSLWQGQASALGGKMFRVALAQQPAAVSECDDATGIGINWVFGTGL